MNSYLDDENQCLSKLSAWLYKIAIGKIGDPCDTEDIVQEVLCLVIEKYNGETLKDGFYKCAEKILKNKIGDYYRQAARERERRAPVSEAFWLASHPESNPDQVYEGKERIRMFERAWPQLRIEEQTLIKMICAGYSRKELMEVMQLKKCATLRLRVFRCRKKLKIMGIVW